jgi:hypothetical protein
MFPKKGKILPGRPKSSAVADNYASVIGAALREELGDSHQATKKLVRWTGASERTVKNWLAGRGGPNGTYLVRVIRHSDTALHALLNLAGREPIIAASRVAEAYDYLACTVTELGHIVNGRRAT